MTTDDHSRVVLTLQDNTLGSDYINSSFIDVSGGRGEWEEFGVSDRLEVPRPPFLMTRTGIRVLPDMPPHRTLICS